jgi:hypothetical protein
MENLELKEGSNYVVKDGKLVEKVRKTKPREQIRTKIIKVPVTEEQYKDLKRLAKESKMPLARYVRQNYIQ